MKKKQTKTVKKVSGGHIRHMGHGTDDMTMIIIAGGAFIVMVGVVLMTGQMLVNHGGPAVMQVNASGNTR